MHGLDNYSHLCSEFLWLILTLLIIFENILQNFLVGLMLNFIGLQYLDVFFPLLLSEFLNVQIFNIEWSHIV